MYTDIQLDHGEQHTTQRKGIKTMTMFEEFAKELNVEITTDKNGFYTKQCKALAIMVNEVILSDDEEIRNADWMDQKEIIKQNFFKAFPYMKQ